MTRSLPVLPSSLDADLLTELQVLGARWADADGPAVSRRGGAGPSDHTAIVFGRR
jgi:hypothetical protein